MNKYRNPNSTTVGTEGAMFNEGTKTEKHIDFNHYGIFSNDNTYAVTFNQNINRPPTKYFENKPVRPPKSNQHVTRVSVEPPVSLTDGGYYLKNDKTKKPPILPPYLKKPEDPNIIQGKAEEKNKGNIYYYKPTKIKENKIHY